MKGTINPDSAKAELCRRSFFDFVQEFWDVIIPEEPVFNWHIPYLCEELERIVFNVKERKHKEYDLLINIPPGTTKTTICTIMLPAWAWTVDPTLGFLTGSYAEKLAQDHSEISRDIIQSDKYRRLFPEVYIAHGKDNKSLYKNNFTGKRITTSVGGTATGMHAHILIMDDLLNAKESVSELKLETAINFLKKTLSTRKIDKAVTVTIMIMQRLHYDDPSGYWLKKEGKKLRHICLPAEVSNLVKPVELKERYIDGLLDPVRLSHDILTEAKSDLGSYDYAGQFQQNPTPEGGGIWKEWFIPMPDNEFPKPGELQSYGTDWDLAYTKNDKNSASACIVSGKMGERMYIDNFDYVFKEMPELLTYMKTHPQPHYIEAKASGISAKQMLVQKGIPAIEVPVKGGGGDKEARARMATPFAEAGMVHVRKSILHRLYHDDKQGILRFPNGSHADVADALAQAIQRHFVKDAFFAG